MKSFFVISLIVLIAAMVSAEESLSSLYARRTHQEYPTRSIHAANQEFGQAQQARAVANQAAQAAHAAHSSQMSPAAAMNARQVNMLVRQAADKATVMLTRWAKAMSDMAENAGREAPAEGQAF